MNDSGKLRKRIMPGSSLGKVEAASGVEAVSSGPAVDSEMVPAPDPVVPAFATKRAPTCHRVAAGKSITTLRGIAVENDVVSREDFSDLESFDVLCSLGYVIAS